MAALFCLHGTRWQQKDGTAGMFAGEALQRFHAVAACRLQDGVRMNALVVNGQVAGVNYLLLDRQTAYGYACGFDPAGRATARARCCWAGPGTRDDGGHAPIRFPARR